MQRENPAVFRFSGQASDPMLCLFCVALYPSELYLGVRSLRKFNSCANRQSMYVCKVYPTYNIVTYDLVFRAEPCRKSENFSAASRGSGWIAGLCLDSQE